MAMEFGRLSKMTVGEVAKNVAVEGGSVVAGLLGAGIVGKQIEKRLGTVGSKAATPTSTMTDKLIAYAANNGPKVALWYLLKKEGKGVLGAYTEDVEKGIVASLALDTVMRIANHGAPKSGVVLWGYDVMGDGTTSINTTPQMQENLQKVLQENSNLRNQLNSALQRIASASPSPVNVNVTPVQSASPFPPDHDRAYGMMTPEEAVERRKNFGAMTPPIEAERNRKYGQMMRAQMNFAGESDSIASAFGML